MEPKTRSWVVFDGGTKFGAGRAELLRIVDAEGSLKAAVERMGMSYRTAWGYVRELEGAAGFAFLERAGSGPSGGMRLTDAGREFLAAYDAFRERVDEVAAQEFAAAFRSLTAGRVPPQTTNKVGRRRTARRRPSSSGA